MGGLGYIIGGALQGAGEGLAAQTESNNQDRRTALLNELQTRRETALAALNHQYRTDEAAAASDLADRNAGRNDARDFAYKTEANAQEHGQKLEEIRIKGTIDLSHDTAIEGLRNKYQLGQIQAKGLVDYQNDAKINHTMPDHYEKTTNGQIIIWNKDGSTRGVIGVDGMFIPSGESVSSSDDDSGGGTIASARAAREGGGGKPTPARRPIGQSSGGGGGNAKVKADALANLGNVYAAIAGDPAKAEQYRQQYPGMFGPDGKLLPRDVLIQRVNQRYGG